MLLLAGCPGSPPDDGTTDVDRDRVRSLAAERVLADAGQPLRITAGRLLDGDRGWDRGQVAGVLVDDRASAGGSAPTRTAVGQRLVATFETLRQTGWTVLWARCTPPAGDGYWQWTAAGYKVSDGVSYGFRLEAELDQARGASASLLLLAPHHRDHDNLYPDAPQGPPVGSTCVERPASGATVAESGTRTVMSPTMSWPGRDQPPDPSMR